MQASQVDFDPCDWSELRDWASQAQSTQTKHWNKSSTVPENEASFASEAQSSQASQSKANQETRENKQS